MDSLQHILDTSWDHYKTHKIDPMTHRPLGDPDVLGFGDSGSQYFMTFSETVSYALFRAVWMNDQNTFNQVWEWAYYNLWRKNLDEIFYWQIGQWGETPQVRKDNLFAWRYVDNIKQKGRGGVIFFKWSPKDQLWRDGLDAAPDGDTLIAGSLLMAHGLWGSKKGVLDYLAHARVIVPEIWNKCVKQIVPGVIDDFSVRPHLKSWFVYSAPSALLTRTLVSGQGPDSHAMEVNYFIPRTKWAGVGKKLDSTDLSSMDALRFVCRGESGHRLKVILKGPSMRNAQKEADASVTFELPSDWKEVTIPLSTFEETNEPMNWKKVDSILLQAEDNNQKGYFAVSALHITAEGQIPGSKSPLWHLTSNDKGESWINVSYYMPFLYPAFKKIDPEHPWDELVASSYYDAALGAKAELMDDEGRVHVGNGRLVPDWFALTVTGKTANVPWTNNLATDDYMHGWDAFRHEFFSAVDYAWTHNDHAKSWVLETGPHPFYLDILDKKGRIQRGYAIDGKTMSGLRGTDDEGPGPNGVYLSLFSACGDRSRAEKMLNNLMAFYHTDGYWGKNPLEYYEQNWAWLGLAFHLNQGLHLRDALQKLG